MKLFDDEPKPIMQYVHDLETKVRELKERNRELLKGMVYVVGAKAPLALGVGYVVGVGFGIAICLLFKLGVK